MRTQPRKTQIAFLKAALFVAALGPLAKLVAGVLYFPESLGANPAEFITRSTGDWIAVRPRPASTASAKSTSIKCLAGTRNRLRTGK